MVQHVGHCLSLHRGSVRGSISWNTVIQLLRFVPQDLSCLFCWILFDQISSRNPNCQSCKSEIPVYFCVLWARRRKQVVKPFRHIGGFFFMLSKSQTETSKTNRNASSWAAPGLHCLPVPFCTYLNRCRHVCVCVNRCAHQINYSRLSLRPYPEFRVTLAVTQ